MRKLIDYILSLSKRWGLDQMMKILGYKKVSNEESWTNHIFMKTHTHTEFFEFFKRNRDGPSILTILQIVFILDYPQQTKMKLSTEEERYWTYAKRLRLVHNQWDKSRARTIGKRFSHLMSSFIYSP